MEGAKQYIERRYARLIELEREKRDNWENLFEKMRILNIDSHQMDTIKRHIIARDSEKLRKFRSKPQISDYEFIKVIGKGAFGEVVLCRCYKSNEPVAIKRMRKDFMISKNKVVQALE